MTGNQQLSIVRGSKVWAALAVLVLVFTAIAVQHAGWARGLWASSMFAVWACAVAHLLTVGRAVGVIGWLIALVVLGPIGAVIYFLLRPYDQWHYAKRQKSFVRGVTYVSLTVLGTAFTLPFFWLLSTSFKPAERIQIWPPDILPMQVVTDGSHRVYQYTGRGKAVAERVGVIENLQGGKAMAYALNPRSSRTFEVNLDDYSPVLKFGMEWRNYSRGLTFIPFVQQLKNTLVICVLCVIGTILSCSLVAYGLCKIEWAGRNTLFMIILSTMMLPYQVIMVPVFAIFVWLGWIDTFLPLTVPAFLGNAFYIFLLRQFFMTIPKDLSEAARLDGCHEFDIYRRVILPLSKPALAMVGLWTFMGAWNEFMGPLIYLVNESKYTLSLGLAMFLGQYGNEYGMLMAVSTVVTIPIIVLFFFTQRTFIQGITMSGIKG